MLSMLVPLVKKQVLFLIIFSIIIGFGLALLVVDDQSFSFKDLSVKEMHQLIVEQRDIAVQKAVKEGNYKCCINPPCTMCFMEANQWNNYQAGTCACDDLIAQGKEPCPQCQESLCETTEAGTCQVSE